MSRSKHHGCGGTCGMCRPWKKWRGNYKKNEKPKSQEPSNVLTSVLERIWDTPEEDEAWKDL